MIPRKKQDEVMRLLTAGENLSATARKTGVSRPAVKGIWERHGETWPPPGAGKLPVRPGRRSKVTREQALNAKALLDAGGRGTMTVVARGLGVDRGTVYRALRRLEQDSG